MQLGNVKGEHWFGPKKISCLTSVGVKTKLRIDLIDFAGHSKFACYDHFHVGTPSTNYRLTIGGYQNWGIGAAGDSMTIHNLNGMSFSTRDRENDRSSSNCAVSYQGAWWYRICAYSNLNRVYGWSDSSGVGWYYINAAAGNWNTSLCYSDMKLSRLWRDRGGQTTSITVCVSWKECTRILTTVHSCFTLHTSSLLYNIVLKYKCNHARWSCETWYLHGSILFPKLFRLL